MVTLVAEGAEGAGSDGMQDTAVAMAMAMAMTMVSAFDVGAEEGNECRR